MPLPVETRSVHADIGVSGDMCEFKSIPQEDPGRYFDSSSHFSQQSISNLDLQGTIKIVGGKLPDGIGETPSNMSAVHENSRPHSGNPMHLLIPNPSEQIRQTNASVKEMTFTMPMDEGPSAVLKRIDISRQLHSSRRIFHLGPGQYKMLMSRSDLEVQLKCLRVERNKIGVAWPQSVSICVNGKPLGNEYLECTQRDKASFYFKLLCHLGDNTLKFKFSPNAFKFAFGVQIVKRVSLEQAVQRLSEFNRLSLARSVSLIKKNFVKGVYDQSLTNESPNACIGNRSNTIQDKRIKVSFICRLLGSKMQTPARGVACKHLQCFDLATYLRTNYKDEMWRCPECDEYAPIERLEIDEFYGFLLTTLKTSNVKEVIIDSSVNWWPVFDDKMDNNNKGNIIIASDDNIDNAKCVHKEGSKINH
uniref:SP-RING-type domain-containing protein n=1 Tax=Glossina austeni TaxID=7395 RepID=A0A1A9VKS5_GLOAU